MKVHQLTIDSGQRDATVHANPHDYIVSLEKPIHNVRQIKLVSARIPTPQLLICGTNQAFDFEVIYSDPLTTPTQHALTFSQGNYDGASLAAGFASVGNFDFNMTYDASKNRFEMGTPAHSGGIGISQIKFKFKTGSRGYDDTSATTTTMHQILGLPALDVSMPGADFGAANFDGPNALVLRLSSGSEQLNQTLPTSKQSPYYTGHILLPGGSDFVNFNGADDKVTHDFHSGPLKTIRELRVEFFYMSHGRLIPYDFRNQDHVLKFEVTCSTDKLENLAPLELPSSPENNNNNETTVNVPGKKKNLYDVEFKIEYLYIMLIVFTGMLLMLSTGKRRAA
jgi:hypothetical protein